MTNLGRAREICRALISAFEKREAVFSDIKELLENQLPDGVTPLSREHANFLFFLISQDHGVKSAKLYERAKALYTALPDSFEPRHIVSKYPASHPDGPINILQALSVRYPRNGARSWLSNSYVLCTQYDGDARKIFHAVTSAEAMKRIRALLGFGPKTGGLLFRVFVGLKLYIPPDEDDIPFPTDIHDTRIAALTDIADIPSGVTESTYMPYVKLAEQVWRQACKEESISWLQVDRALWILGSKGCTNERHFDCPIRRYCKLGSEFLL